MALIDDFSGFCAENRPATPGPSAAHELTSNIEDQIGSTTNDLSPVASSKWNCKREMPHGSDLIHRKRQRGGILRPEAARVNLETGAL
jgi:hypothetical protein